MSPKPDTTLNRSQQNYSHYSGFDFAGSSLHVLNVLTTGMIVSGSLAESVDDFGWRLTTLTASVRWVKGTARESRTFLKGTRTAVMRGGS